MSTPKAATQAAALPFDPTLPCAIALPWGGNWRGVDVVLDLYRCELFMDEEPNYMADSQREKKALDARKRSLLDRQEAIEEARRALLNAPEDGVAAARGAWLKAKEDIEPLEQANTAYTLEYRGWRRANCLRQIKFFVLSLEMPDGKTMPGNDENTWKGFPLRMLEWVADDAFSLAREEMWSPKLPTESSPDSGSEDSGMTTE